MIDKVTVVNADWAQDSSELVKLRDQVFIKEQSVPAELEIDGLDPECRHAKAIVDGKVVGTGRLLPNGHIGRMCVHSDYRQLGIGSLLLANLVDQAMSAGYAQVALNSQCDAIPFYEKNDFVIDSEVFMDAGIPHRKMILINS